MMSASPESEFPAERRRSQRKGNRPAAVLGGLVVVWLSFYLVAMAQDWSSNKIRIHVDSRGELSRQETIIADLGPRAKGLLMYDGARFLQASPREIVERLVERAQLDVGDIDLIKVSDQPRPVQFRPQPFYRLLRELIDNRDVGFSLQKNQLRIFDQQVEEIAATESSPARILWDAMVELTDEPTAFFPFPDSDISLILTIRPALSMAVWPDPVVRIEVWRETQRLATGQGTFSPDMKSDIELGSQGMIKVSLEGLRDKAGQAERTVPSVYRMSVVFEPSDSNPIARAGV